MANKPADFTAFLQMMKAAGYEAKHGKYLAFKPASQQKFIRIHSLGENYSEEALRTAIAGITIHKPVQKRKKFGDPNRINLLVDIQAKLKAGKGHGYEQWAKVFNLKQMARTLAYLNENSISDYDQLVEKSRHLIKDQLKLGKQIRSINEELKERRELRTYIINFAKSKNVYDEYRKSHFSQKFYIVHRTDIVLHRSAKAAFNKWHGEKLPSAKILQTQIQKLQLSKSDLVMQLIPLKKESRDCLNALANVNRVISQIDYPTINKDNHFTR